MVIRDTVRQKIDSLPEGVVITASDFDVPRQYRATLVKALNQFEYAGVLKKVSRGRYYKPRQSRFGELKPSESEIVKDFLQKDGRVIGYITGTRAFADIALTTQISQTIMIGSNVSRRPLVRGQYKISFLLQPNPITEEDIPLFVLLDALKLIKTIPATTPSETISRMVSRIRQLPDDKRERLVKLGLAYQPYVRALLGAMMEKTEGKVRAELEETLNPVSRYNVGISSTALSTATNWNIV